MSSSIKFFQTPNKLEITSLDKVSDIGVAVSTSEISPAEAVSELIAKTNKQLSTLLQTATTILQSLENKENVTPEKAENIKEIVGGLGQAVEKTSVLHHAAEDLVADTYLGNSNYRKE